MELRIDRNRLMVIGAVVALVLIAGVIVVATHGGGSSDAGAAPTPAATDTVSVSGVGSVEGVPDTLVANLHIHAKEASVQEALDAVAADAHKVIAALRSRGVPAIDIKSTDLSLNPDYDRHGNVDGYDSGESLTVRIQPLTKVGQILTAAAGAAGNSVNVDGLSFDIADDSALLTGARQAAFNNAKAAAAQYATLGGTSLGRVVSIKAVVHNTTPIVHGFGDAAAGSALAAGTPVPIQPGQKKVSVTVDVVWALQ
jgi:hypothetical protein